MTTPERQEKRTGLAKYILQNTATIEERMRKRGIELSVDPDLERRTRTMPQLVRFDNRVRYEKDTGHIFRVSYRDQRGNETEGEIKPGAKRVKKIWTEHEDINLFLKATEKIRDSYARPEGEVAQRVQEIIKTTTALLDKYQKGQIRPEDLEKVKEEVARARVKSHTDVAVKPNLRAIDDMFADIGELDSLRRFNPGKDEMILYNLLVRAVEERMFGEAVHDKYGAEHDEGLAKKGEFELYLKTARADLVRVRDLSPRSPEYDRTARRLDLMANEQLPKVVVQPFLKPAVIATLVINGTAVRGDEYERLERLGVEEPLQFFSGRPVYALDARRRRAHIDDLLTRIDLAIA